MSEHVRDEGAELLKRMVFFGGAIALTGWFLFYVFLPAWKLALGLRSGWTVLAVIFGGSLVGSRINVPLPFRSGGHRVAFNVFGFLAPIAIGIWMALDLRPSIEILPLVLMPAATLVVCLRTVPTPIGVLSRRRDLYLLVGVLTLTLTLSSLTTREVMFWSFTTMYVAGLVADIYHLVAHGDAFDHPVAHAVMESVPEHRRVLSIGGAGSNDGLWLGPALAVLAAFVLAWLFSL